MAKVAIFGGHNGTNETGAYGNGLTEKAVAKEAAQIATSYAERCGHSVINGFGKSLSERVKYANSENVVAVLEIHANSGGGQGAETLFCDGIASAKADALAVAAAGSIKGLKNRGAKPDSSTRHGRLAIVRDTKAQALLHELFFIDSASDVAIWKNNKKAIMESITKEWLKRRGLNSVVKTTSKPAPAKPATPSKPATSNSAYNNKKLVSKVAGLRFYSKPSWADKDLAGTVGKGIGFPTVVEKVKVGTAYQYKVKNSKGATYYITASDKYVELKNK
ncbi:N-acetylmuramoyl-L-alanine amidase [Listeria monocytogenes]|uniref:N-acetylmuramoyl-L-alanine amidase n=1 Tax=Listeria marthii TaxID=529731 RepID=UPI001887DB94|nr:N-acetylmuramoyl-L-alanine amidase [Listeria marthii]EHC6300175.1 N-acetylmuramoyl-L-alanine amidase [Listeria monocytogenes]EHC6354989.1 N-acetylmuramoyl-L-alanine amidase [Listeria monocytogenes]EID6355159.1 N-acetylmuramoyl-L-alanine amidase [Listeria monocytogenes]MBF2519868.1 N-acetylmuramoyl-L-alanine amidase [Listeria marthii]